ncbi:sodium-dependent transporter bedraggled isoform X1 [Stomoxys calcitrans]|uniref:sodium-dependent transporter bedraggled isoform X1 n=1 Tax=Stomoxys calcitrans TaxID=35570 RepID=UPI0027E34CC9|nr:sodium-dependent transporter bedraggled isoform X1 [Stomoxys calcitrans]XP_013115225.2 sodium-dependent transporter bedraggled isoform X1 [Stomoxys calcitrans]
MNSEDNSAHGCRCKGLKLEKTEQFRHCPRSVFSFSVDDSSNNNLQTQCCASSCSDGRLASKSVLSYCTERRRWRHSAECLESSGKVKSLGNSVSCSLSDNLSRESIRNACGYVDDLSDNDLREVHTIPGNFQSRLPAIKRSFLDGKMFMKRKNSEEKPLYLEDNQSLEVTTSPNDEASNALRVLDAVLDIHDTSLVESFRSSSPTDSDTEQIKINDCLLELDDFLDKMDDGMTRQSEDNIISDTENTTATAANSVFLQRGGHLRKTVGSFPGPSVSTSSAAKAVSVCATLRKSGRSSPVVFTGEHNGIIRFPSQHTIVRLDESDNRKPPGSCEDLDCLSQDDCSPNSNQILTDDQIFRNLIEQNESRRIDTDIRPRQYGRRAERNSQMSIPDGRNGGRFPLNYTARPMSAPVTSSRSVRQTEQDLHNTRAYVMSDGSTGRSSRTTSPVTIASSSDSSELSQTSHNIMEPSDIVNEGNSLQGTNQSSDVENVESTQKPGFNTYWPHSYSRTLALLSCTLGLFNICRFAVLTINYGPNFLIQFLLLSIVFGVPFFWLQMCLGAKIRAGPVSMWRISPICSGIGIAIILVQYFITIYSSVVIVWLLVYLSDTFMYQSSYRWAETSNFLIPRNFSHTYTNLTESVADYFNVNVLQRLQILKLVENSSIRLHISDRQLAFYLAILWALVFLILCKGLRSFGKVLFVIGIVPLIALAVVTGKLLYVVDLMKLQNSFSSSELDDFLINSKTWTVASQETFLTWGLLGASVIAITSRSHKNNLQTTLRRDAILVVLSTLIGLCLSALMGLCCIQILNQSGYVYVPGSYEKPESYASVYSLKSSLTSNIISYPSKLVPHYSSLIGEVYRRQGDVTKISGYQVLRFATELFPAVLVIADGSFSWAWAALVFLMLFVFGISQLCVMWKPISSALGNSTSAVLLSCVTGLLLSIPFATEVGITLLHYIDSLIGGAWFIPILWASEIFGIFLIRGRPYNGDDLVNDLKMSGSMSAFLALSWNVFLPISLITLAVIEYKISLSSQLYYWRGRSYYSFWARKVGALIQVGFLLLVPITSIIQIYRYLTTGPPDILDRIQMLYRPLDGTSEIRLTNRFHRNSSDTRYRPNGSEANAENGITNIPEDAPPKYTPPPSYTTATGVRLAKILRQSIRRSVRRLLGDSGRTRPVLSIQIEQNDEPTSYPPDYLSVLTTPSAISNVVSETIEIGNRPSNNLLHGRSLSLGRKSVLQKKTLQKRTGNTYRPSSAPREIIGSFNENRASTRTSRAYTAEDVITILRSSTRGKNLTSQLAHVQNQTVFRSTENLVFNAEPPGTSSSVLSEQLKEIDHDNTSVI